MGGRENLLDYIIFLPLFLLAATTTLNAGASSTPKNLVNLYTHSSNNSSNQTSINHFQNEYQFWHSNTKPYNVERHRSQHETTQQNGQDSNPEHSSKAEGSPSGRNDYIMDNRATSNVPDCKGRLKLSNMRGYITDGPGYYHTNLQCVWLIDAGRNNATIRIQIHQFNTECNYDYLYIFDGDSITSPLIAALSGDIKDFGPSFTNTKLENMISSRTNQTSTDLSGVAVLSSTTPTSRPLEIKATSGKAFIYFHSDTAQTMPGFYMTYSIDSCPLDCSHRGECDYFTLECRCDQGYYGDACQYQNCPNNCTSIEQGVCEQEKFCSCKEGFHGIDCSFKTTEQVWMSVLSSETKISPRAFHRAIAIDGIMWIIGGKTSALSSNSAGHFNKRISPVVTGFNLTSRKWTDFRLDGTTGIDHLAELTGHSISLNGSKIFIYGGMAMNNSILNSLTIFDTETHALTSLAHNKRLKTPEEEFSLPLALVGHSAIIVDEHMYIFLGYNPLYGYINVVQKYKISDGSWSLANRRGSSITGCIGHTTTYDPVDKLIYLYGGHHTRQLPSLHSFDPKTESWTLLEAGPSPRYYHSSVILDRHLVILGGNSYNTSHQSDQCFQQTYLSYDLSCTKNPNSQRELNQTTAQSTCRGKCWHSISTSEQGLLKRHGHTVISNKNELVLFGGFNGLLLNDVEILTVNSCGDYLQETECVKPKLGLTCRWHQAQCQASRDESELSAISNTDDDQPSRNCSETKALQNFCEGRETCSDCLNTNAGCVWCGFMSQCQYNKCRTSKLASSKEPLTDPSSCYRDDHAQSSPVSMNFGSVSDSSPVNQDSDDELECKRIENCYLCNSKSHCSWHNEGCFYSSPNLISSPITSLPSSSPQDNQASDMMTSRDRSLHLNNSSSRALQRFDPFNRSFLAALTTSLFNSSPYQTCDIPCYMRRNCGDCTTTKCIWCSTSEQCMDSSAYFAYHAMGQCMHYVAHMIKCPVASCADIETCDKCLTNPKCGWLNDISNTGKGRCIEGTSLGPSIDSSIALGEPGSTAPATLPNWFYTSCPSCQCNGHSFCKANSSICAQPCQDNTEGSHCDRCISGHYGDPVNGGSCWPCRCNGHAHSCHSETGRCFCSTKGMIGHNCNRCDDQNHYIGDPAGPGNDTCYYNLTTDFQYTFNMSKPEDHHYSEINFINVPLRRDSDVDFTIACSRLALVNVTYGPNYKNRKPVHTNLECGSFRLRFPHERLIQTESNHSFFVHVYKFQTPLILQIAFTQHRTLYLPQFFFTFSR